MLGRGRLSGGGWMEPLPSEDPSGSGLYSLRLAIQGGSHPVVASLCVLPGANGVQLASLANMCESRQALVVSSSSNLTPYVGLLPSGLPFGPIGTVLVLCEASCTP